MTLHESKCGCCGCKSRNILRKGPLRGDGVGLSDAGQSLAAWLNQDRDLNDYEPTDSSPGHPYDGFGPTHIVSAQSTWQQLDRSHGYAVGCGSATFDLNASAVSALASFLPLASDNPSDPFTYQPGDEPSGDELNSSLVLTVYGNTSGKYSVELVHREYPEDFYDNKPISYDAAADGDNRINTYVYGWGRPWSAYVVFPNMSSRLAVSFNDLPETAGLDSFGRPVDASSGTPLSSFKEWKLEGIESFVIYSESMSLLLGWAVSEMADAGSPDPTRGGFDAKLLLHINESKRLVNTPGPARNFGNSFLLAAYATQDDDNFPGTAVVTACADRGQPNNFTASVWIYWAIPRTRVTYFRNGEQVFQAINPTSGPIASATSDEGSYLVVSEALPSVDSSGNTVSTFAPRMIKDYSSFVVDKTKPIVAFVPVDDMQNGVDYRWLDLRPRVVMSTEPVSTNLLYGFNTAPDEDASFPVARPAYPSSSLIDNGNVGQHTISLPDGFRDQRNNTPEFSFSQTWMMHPPLQRYREGVKALIEEPGLQTREYNRPRLSSEPVRQLRMSFSRKIDPSGVSASQFRLQKSAGANMEDVDEGLSIAPVGDGSRDWVITVTAEQPERTFFLLSYDAGGDVVTDDIQTLHFRSQNDFPATGQYKIIYECPSDDGGSVRYSWSPSGYIRITGDYPLDRLGQPYEPEPCVIVSRVGWLMADMNGWPRLIDTSFTQPQLTIGRIASVTETVDIDAGKVDSTITAKGGLYIAGRLGNVGTFSPGTTFKGFTPGVPSLESPEDDASWWGLTTTIDPSPPALISACAAPKCPQRHASAIRCDGDITELELTLEPVTGTGFDVDYSTYKYTVAQGGFPFNATKDFDVISGPFSPLDQSPFTDVGVLLVAKTPTKLTFIDTLEGDPMSQNVWSCVQDGNSASLEVAERCTRSDGYKCGDGDEKWYTIELSAPTRDVSFDDVKDWDVDPDFGHYAIARDGQQVTPDKFMPGDRYDWWAAPSLAGKAIPWWSDRLNPYEREEYEYVRGNGSGVIRKLTHGTIEWVKTQGTISASRSCKEFKGLKTTTLGELVISISLRITAKATLEYEDRKNAEQYYGPANSGSACFDGTWDNTARAIRPGPVFGQSLTDDANAFVTGFKWGARIRARGTWEDADQQDSRTLTHRFFADLNSGFVLTAEDEEKLANGEELTFPAYFADQRDSKFWKWKLKAKVGEAGG